MKRFFILLCCFSFAACNQKGKQLSAVVAKRGINLATIKFDEKPLEILKSKIDSNANNDASYVKKGYSDPFDYPVAYKLEPWNGDNSFYGKAYYSKIIDSIAYYGDIYFNRIAFLVHEGKTVTVLADAEIKSDTVYNKLIKNLNKQFGEPTFSPQTTQDVFYEWTSADKHIQIDYSTGASVTAMSGKDMEVKQIFDMQMLIFNKQAAKAIRQIQQANYAKTKDYKVMQGDFKLYKDDPQKNIVLMDSLLNEKFK